MRRETRGCHLIARLFGFLEKRQKQKKKYIKIEKPVVAMMMIFFSSLYGCVQSQ